MNNVTHESFPAEHSAGRPLVGVSLKLYFGLAETRRWLAEVAALAPEIAALPRPVDLVVLPAFPALSDARELLAGTGVTFGAQDVHWADRGPWTGEVSAPMLAEAGAGYAVVGHAERRRHFGEDDETVAAKVRAATAAGLTPIVCAGERHGEDTARAAEETVAQVRAALGGLGPEADGEVVVAYEPVWAIGAASPAPAAHVAAVTAGVADWMREHGVRGRLLYGGTAGPGTYSALVAGQGAPVDGLFLGRLAHDTANLRKVLEEVAGAAPEPAPGRA